MVDRAHVWYLANAAAECQYFRYFWNGQSNAVSRLESKDPNTRSAAGVASSLYRENARSVHARYGGEMPYADCGTPIPSFAWLRFDPVQVIKACHCLAYQSCETDDWEETEAAAILRAIESAYVRRLIGYEEAEWGAPAVIQDKLILELVTQ